MSEYQPLTTVAEINNLNDDECVEGYRAGLHGDPEPGSDKSKSYWHGWRNGMIDSHRMPMDHEAEALARSYVARQRTH